MLSFLSKRRSISFTQKRQAVRFYVTRQKEDVNTCFTRLFQRFAEMRICFLISANFSDSVHLNHKHENGRVSHCP